MMTQLRSFLSYFPAVTEHTLCQCDAVMAARYNRDAQYRQYRYRARGDGRQLMAEHSRTAISDVSTATTVAAKPPMIAEISTESESTAQPTPSARKCTPSFERTPRDLIIGALLVLAGGIMWGTNATVSKILMDSYAADPLWIACVRELLAGVMFLAFAGATESRQVIGMARDRASYPKLIGCALVCVLAVQVAYLSAIDWTNSDTATVLQSLNLLFVLVFVCARGRRWPVARETVGVALAFAGTVLLATGGDVATLRLPLMGLLWGLIDAAATSALSIMPVKLIARWGNLAVNGAMFVISGLVLLPFVRPWSGAPALDWFGLLLMTYTVIGGTFGAFWAFLAGTMRIGSMRATLLGTSEPIAATISAVAWTGAVFAPTDLAGFAMILAMVFLVR